MTGAKATAVAPPQIGELVLFALPNRAERPALIVTVEDGPEMAVDLQIFGGINDGSQAGREQQLIQLGPSSWYAERVRLNHTDRPVEHTWRRRESS